MRIELNNFIIESDKDINYIKKNGMDKINKE